MKSNKIIAEFMGWKSQGFSSNFFWQSKREYFKRDKDEPMFFIEGFVYHSDWNALINVIHKIESMGYRFTICRKRVMIYTDTNPPECVFDVKEDSKKASCYLAVIQFIKWKTHHDTPTT